MSIEIRWSGQLGNNCFQYIVARLFAEKQNLKIVSDFPYSWLMETTPQMGHRIESPIIRITDEMPEFFDWAVRPARYVFDGFFQRSRWIKNHRDKIKTFFELPVVEKNSKDFAIHIRLKDYRWSWEGGRVIHPSWYLKCIQQEMLQKPFEKLHIFTDEVDPKYLEFFKQFNPEVHSGNVADDFNALRTFERIASSNGTFSWLAACLGHAERVYIFKPFVRESFVELTDFHGAVVFDGEFLPGGKL